MYDYVDCLEITLLFVAVLNSDIFLREGILLYREGQYGVHEKIHGKIHTTNSLKKIYTYTSYSLQ